MSPAGGEADLQGDFTIRRATPAQAPLLAALRYGFRAELGEVREQQEAFVGRCAEWMAARLAPESRWRAWLGFTGAEAIGTAWLHLIEKIPNPVGESELQAYVTNLYVVPRCRGRGIGTKLLVEAIEESRAARVDAVVLRPSPRSRPLYQRFGFGVRDDLLVLRLASSS